MHIIRTSRTRHLPWALLATAAACGDGGGGGGTITEPDQGQVRVTVAMTGRVPDRDGFSVYLGDAQAGTVTPAAALSVPGVPAGARTVTLRGVSRNCQVTGDSVKSASVAKGATVDVAFQVSCPGTGMAYITGESGPRKLMVRYPWSTQPDKLADSVVQTVPSWSPDGYTILFVKAVADWQRIFAVDTETGGVRLVGGVSVHYNIHPAWSPDGSRIAYASGGEGGAEIHVMNADGTGSVALLSAPGLNQVQPAWSSDGTRIAFLGSRSSDRDVYVVNRDGSGLARLNATPVSGSYSTLSWSPDGAWLTYAGSTNNHDDIFVIRSNGQQNTNLTNTPQVAESAPVFRANGRISYSRIVRIPAPEPWDIWEMAVDGTGNTNLTNTPVPHEQLAAWQ